MYVLARPGIPEAVDVRERPLYIARAYCWTADFSKAARFTTREAATQGIAAYHCASPAARLTDNNIYELRED